MINGFIRNCGSFGNIICIEDVRVLPPFRLNNKYDFNSTLYYCIRLQRNSHRN